jgi:hypothetical protein
VQVPESSLLTSRTSAFDPFVTREFLLRQGILKLLAIKDSDIRILTIEQSRDAVDNGLHAGGAFSAIIPLVALFYGGGCASTSKIPLDAGRICSRSARATPSRHWHPSTLISVTSTEAY